MHEIKWSRWMCCLQEIQTIRYRHVSMLMVTSCIRFCFSSIKLTKAVVVATVSLLSLFDGEFYKTYFIFNGFSMNDPSRSTSVYVLQQKIIGFHNYKNCGQINLYAVCQGVLITRYGHLQSPGQSLFWLNGIWCHVNGTL